MRIQLADNLRRRRAAADRLQPLPDGRRDPLDPAADDTDRRPVVVAFWQPRRTAWAIVADRRQTQRLGWALDLQVDPADGYAVTTADHDHLRHAARLCGLRLIIAGDVADGGAAA